MHIHFGQRGQALIQVLVAAAILSVILLATSTMVSNFSKENRALNEKLAALDLQRILSASLADGLVCKYILTHPANITFDSTKVTVQTPVSLVPTLPLYANIVVDNVGNQTPGPVVAQIDGAAAVFSNSVVIQSIALVLTGASAATAQKNATFTGQWVVSFYNDRLVRSIHPVAVSTVITADVSQPANAVVTSCQGSGGGGTGPHIAGSPCTTSGYPNNTGVTMGSWLESGGRGKFYCCGPWMGWGWGCDALP